MLQTLRKRTEFLTVLRHRDYRIYYFGLVASVMGHQGLIVAQGWLVFEISGLPAALGFVAAAQAVPSLVLNLLAGAMADRLNPRKMVIIGQGGAGIGVAVLATVVLLDAVQLWHIVAVAFMTGIFDSFDQPARRSIWPPLVPRAEMLFANSMQQGVWQGTRVLGPAIATGIIAVVGAVTGDPMLGAAISFYVITAGFASMVVAMVAINLPKMKRATGATVFHDIVDGLAFTYRNRILMVLLLMSFVLGYFGLSYMWLMPAFAKDVLGVGPEGLGLLMAANGLGGTIGVFGMASFGGYQNRAWVLGGGAVLSGAAVILFSLTGVWPLFPLAVAFAVLGGGLTSLFQVAAATLLNLLVPNEFRGRVLGLRGLTWSLSPLGALQAGLIATWVNIPFAIGLGGVVVIVSTLLFFAFSSQLRNVRKLVEEVDAIQAAESAVAP